MLSLLWIEFKSCKEQIIHVAEQLQALNKATVYNSFVDCFDSDK